MSDQGITKASTGALLRLQQVKRHLYECQDIDLGAETWLTAIVAFVAENQPEILDDVLRLKLQLARKLHYTVLV
jgi:hypothetical protein